MSNGLRTIYICDNCGDETNYTTNSICSCGGVYKPAPEKLCRICNQWISVRDFQDHWWQHKAWEKS